MSPWLISRRDDLTWFHGSVIAGILLLLFFWLNQPLSNDNYGATHLSVIVLLLWGVLFDGTHVFGTYVRSYLAPNSAQQNLPGPWSLWLVVLGPLLAVLDAAFLSQQPSLLGQAGWLFRGFLLFAYLWAYFDLVRQHYGFLVLYRRRMGATIGTRLDSVVLWFGCLYPFARFSFTDGYLRSGLPLLFPPDLNTKLRGLLDVIAVAVALVLLSLLWKRAKRLKPGPSELLLGIVIGFHLLVFALLDNLLTITATLTIFHNMQYHRIVWQYESGHHRRPAGGMMRYLGWGILLGTIWYGPRVMGVALSGSSLIRNLLLGFGWGVAFHHYYVDSRIWRVRRTPAIAEALDRGASA